MPAHSAPGRGGLQQLGLEHGQAKDLFFPRPPLQVDAPAENAEVAARSIDED
jgi:hypothetical protein